MSRLQWLMGLATFACASAAWSAAGDLDPTFSGDGVVTAAASSGQGRGLAIDATGNVVAAGYTGSDVNGTFLVTRFTDSGAPDLTFDVDGEAQTTFDTIPGSGHTGAAVAVDGSGRIVVAGSINGRDSAIGIGVARFLDNGMLDPAFNGNGQFETGGGAVSYGADVAIDGAGGVLVLGSGGGSFFLARVTDAGLDAAFGTAGVATGPGGLGQAIGIDSAGRILVAGYSGIAGSSTVQVRRYTSAGVVDATFAAGGTASVSIGASQQAFDLAIDSSDRVVVVGTLGQGPSADFLIFRLDANGVLDTAFNATGSLVVPVSTAGDIAFGVDLDSSGAIYVGGMAGGDTGVIKVLDNGTLDATFGVAGVSLLDLQADRQDAAFDLLVDAQDRVLVGGRIFAVTGNNGYRLSVARLEVGASADLSITKTNGAAQSVPGANTVYTIVASNAGPSAVVGASVTDTFPAACTTVSWTCATAGGATCTAGPVAGNINELVDLPVGATATFTATCSISPAATGSLVNTADIAAPVGVDDPVPGNNSATDTDTLVVTADLSITKTNGAASSTPGTNTTYTIVASNAGPSLITGATVSDTFPAACASVSWTCVAAGGATCTAGPTAGNINDVINLPVASSATYTAICSIAPAATGTLANTATIAAPVGATDPTPGNNSATDSDTLVGNGDLSITKTNGATSSTPGTNTTYTIVASNAGPSLITGATVSDTFPAACASVSSTCVPAGGATCSAGPVAGNINDVINMPAGSSATYTATCAIDPAATGTLDNTASIAAPVGSVDPTPGNNSATDSDGLTATADLSMTKQAIGVPNPLQVGSAFQYQLDVSNAGPSATTGVIVTDTLPANLTYVSNTCGAGFAAPTLTWNIGALAAAGSAQCLISVTVSDFGPISNTAVVSSTATDPVAANDSSTSTLAGVPFPADVAITLTSNAPVGGLQTGDIYSYTVTGTNNGPGEATGLSFLLSLTNKLSVISSSCGAVLAGNDLSWTVATLANGASTSCEISVQVIQGRELLASASVTTTSVDPDLTNNSAELVLSTSVIAVPTMSLGSLLMMLLVIAGVGIVALRLRS